MSKAKRARITVAVTKETRAVYEDLANAGNHTLSRSVGDFLAMMEPYAEFLAHEYRQALLCPQEAVRNAADLIERVRWQMRVEKKSSCGWSSEFEADVIKTN